MIQKYTRQHKNYMSGLMSTRKPLIACDNPEWLINCKTTVSKGNF